MFSTGALGAGYRRFNPRARLLGIDKDPERPALAWQRLDDVAAVDVEDRSVAFHARSAARLRHLRRRAGAPERSVGGAAPPCRALSDDGTIVICVPNLEHWSFADRLLRGMWKYEASGLLDETHLRWFSLETMRKGWMLSDCFRVM